MAILVYGRVENSEDDERKVVADSISFLDKQATTEATT